jgi:lysozyme family protein
MDSNWPQSLKYVRLDEGGNDDDPVDPGGRTSRGIIQREYDAWRAAQHLPKRDVWAAADAEVDAIYREQYWEPWCPQFPSGLDYLFFDMDVNMGFHEAALLLQRGLRVKADGKLGIVTLNALKACNASLTIANITAAKSSFYHQLRTWWKYGKGWTARYMHAAQRATAMAKGDQDATSNASTS